MAHLALPRRAAALLTAAAGLVALQHSPASAAPVAGVPAPTVTRIQPGDAVMGWKQKLEAASGASQVSAQKAYVPTGVLGIDVSRWQGNVNWPAYAAAGKRFAYVKATEGTSYTNPYFRSQYTGSYAAGLIRGAYHFANPAGSTGKRQADYFVAHGGGWSADGHTLPGVLDIEYNPYGATCYGLSKTQMVSWVSSFITQYKKRTKRDAVIYTTTDWWTRCTGNSKKFSATNPLWLARYGTTSPGKLPGAWQWATFWQYSATPIDQNRFSSSYKRLVVLATKAKV